MSTKIEIPCPKCDHVQFEPRAALSTHCRSCGLYYRVIDGVAVDPSKPSSTPRFSKTDSLTPIQPAEDQPAFTLDRTASQSLPSRAIECFECDAVIKVPEKAQSSICNNCGSYINLEDMSISGLYNREIKTLGKVEIQRKSSAQGVTIHCRDLIVHGEITGPVVATDTVELNTRGKLRIKGLKAKKLILGRRCELTLVGPIEAQEVIVAGHLIGEIHCSGPVILSKTAKVDGDIYMKSIQVDPGATHNGSVQTFVDPEENEHKQPA